MLKDLTLSVSKLFATLKNLYKNMLFKENFLVSEFNGGLNAN
jgi:hypothetical protein